MLCSRLHELPPPPPEKIGWPWTEESKRLVSHKAEGCVWPCLSVIAPSFNQCQFIEGTIRSVLLQGYPNLDYLIMDGGSTDCSVEIITKYSPWLTYWVSEPDSGQSATINGGVKLASGFYATWINSDDLLCKNALVHHASQIGFDSDGVILVFHAQKTTRASARRAVECLEIVRAPILGTILAGIDLDNPDYFYYRHYYGSNYGDVATDDKGSSNGKNNGAVVQPELPEAKLSPIEPVAVMVSREFFDKMIAELSEAMGPMASQIVIERVALMGESLDSFPTRRLKELLEKVCEEIQDDKLSQSFQDAMALEIIRSP